LTPGYFEFVRQLAIVTFPKLLSLGGGLVALAIALALIFAGRYIIKVIAFIGVGIAFASAAAALGAVILGILGLVLGGMVGFFIGGILSLFLLPLAIGVASGFIAYDLMQLFFHLYPVSIIVGVIFFVIGLVFSMKFLTLATATFGALLLFDVLVFFHFPPLIGLVISFLMGVIGFWTQDGFERKGPQGTKFSSWSRNPPPTSAVPVHAAAESMNASVRHCSYCGAAIDSKEALFCPNCGARLGS